MQHRAPTLLRAAPRPAATPHPPPVPLAGNRIAAMGIYHPSGLARESLASRVQLNHSGISGSQPPRLPAEQVHLRAGKLPSARRARTGAEAGQYSHLGDIVILGAPLRHGEGGDARHWLRAPDPPGTAATGRGAA